MKQMPTQCVKFSLLFTLLYKLYIQKRYRSKYKFTDIWSIFLSFIHMPSIGNIYLSI